MRSVLYLVLLLATAALPVIAADSDGDGVDDTIDCAPDLRSTWAIPSETSPLRWSSQTALTWQTATQAHTHNVYRGTVPAGSPFSYNHTCFAPQRVTRDAVDADLPAPGDLFFYVVGGRNRCGDGSLGSGASGPRPDVSSCPIDASSDSDADGVPDNDDVCASVSDPGQDDNDLDGIGTACDVCPFDSSNDADGDGACVADGDCDDGDANRRPDNDEICDGADNDCDILIDEDPTGDPLIRSTLCGVGPCAGNSGVETCVDGVFGGDTCDPFQGASPEVCDAQDNDCDALIDEDATGSPLTRATTCGVGACAGNVGVETCLGAAYGGDTCDPLDGSTPEFCDGQDNDCDGLSDDGFTDTDNDGVGDTCDNCPDVANADQADADNDGVGDACDVGGVVVIAEVHYDQASGQQEFIELLASGAEVDITGWRLTDGDVAPAPALSLTFATTDPKFPCTEPFVLAAGDRLVVWHGTGTQVCSGSSRSIYLGGSTLLAAAGDDLMLEDATLACRDYVAYESAGTPPIACAWTGPNPSNGNVAGTSISRFDAAPLTDTDAGADWEASGATTTVGPRTPGQANEPAAADSDADGVADAVDNCPTVANADQLDSDTDGVGDVCDACPTDPSNDVDADGVCGAVDNCPFVANPDQADADSDGIGDACEPGSGRVVISEVHYDQASGQQEFMELLAAGASVDITSWRLSDLDTGTNSFALTFATSDPKFPCAEPFVLAPGDRLVVWGGAGTAVCSGASRSIFLTGGAVFPAAGDDLMLEDQTLACRDYVAFESGVQVSNPPPSACTWTGPNPSNGNVVGTSISRFDAPLLDTDAGADWEASGATTTIGPRTPGQPNK